MHAIRLFFKINKYSGKSDEESCRTSVCMLFCSLCILMLLSVFLISLVVLRSAFICIGSIAGKESRCLPA